ncbi:ABC transporter permease [Streptomyces calidiresistens]|uniref:ABC transporter permease n=2 Tax=Streptomyces calidiresistens TaxID=1485586 RepID=A0A7W3T099_9ACTN|nr:ABC transporter permease [Streptomyces calidiresistens]
MGSIGRAELTLLLRNRTALMMALIMPFFMAAATYSVSREMDLAEVGLSVGALVITGGIGMILLFVVYSNVISVYVARREERVLKRLRTGELSDGEVLAGAALPSAVLALAQCLLLVGIGTAALDIGFPEQPVTLLLGLLLGPALMVLLAAVTAAFTRTVESAQITALPLFMVSAFASGLIVPLETLPDTMADIFRFLPMTPVIELVRGGWLGTLEGTDVLRALAIALVWTGVAVFAVRRWFRWDPRA